MGAAKHPPVLRTVPTTESVTSVKAGNQCLSLRTLRNSCQVSWGENHILLPMLLKEPCEYSRSQWTSPHLSAEMTLGVLCVQGVGALRTAAGSVSGRPQPRIDTPSREQCVFPHRPCFLSLLLPSLARGWLGVPSLLGAACCLSHACCPSMLGEADGFPSDLGTEPLHRMAAAS